jgi:hypothetical protein
MMQDDKQQARARQARTQSRAARTQIPVNDRLSFSPAEFAALNNKSATWGYRRIYRGDIKVIAGAGRLLIPRCEVDRFLARAAEYNPQRKAKAGDENGGAA